MVKYMRPMICIRSATRSQVLLFMCASVDNYERAIQAEQIPSDSDRRERKICILFEWFHKLSCLSATLVCAGDVGSTEIAWQYWKKATNMHWAVQSCRGFTGSMRSLHGWSFHWSDLWKTKSENYFPATNSWHQSVDMRLWSYCLAEH